MVKIEKIKNILKEREKYIQSMIDYTRKTIVQYDYYNSKFKVIIVELDVPAKEIAGAEKVCELLNARIKNFDEEIIKVVKETEEVY